MNSVQLLTFLTAPIILNRYSNDFSSFHPEVIAMESLMFLSNKTVMANLVYRDFETEVADKGSSVSTRKPSAFTAQNRNGENKVIVQSATATKVQVTLSQQKHVSFLIDRADAAKSVKDLREDYLEPAMDALAQVVDTDILGLFADILAAPTEYPAFPGSSVGSYGSPLTLATIISARETLNVQQAPNENRRIVFGPQGEGELLNIAEFTAANFQPVAVAGSAAESGSVTRRYGFDFYLDQNVPLSGGGYNNLAFHKNAFGLVTRLLPELPGLMSTVVNYRGIGIRYCWVIDPEQFGLKLLFEILYGVHTYDPYLASVVEN